jgi:dolichol-phosphate mannosyltransferase
VKTLIVIPTYNENGNIRILLERILGIVDCAATDILVVDDNSGDGTPDTVRSVMAEHPNVNLLSRAGKLGLASAYLGVFAQVQRGGLASKGYEAILMMDADLSHPPEYIPQMLAELATHDMVNGSRYIKGGRIENWSFHRRFLSYWGNVYVRTILHTGIKDMSTGYLCFRVTKIRDIDLARIRAKGYAFLSEMKYLFRKLNFRIKEIPIAFTDRVDGDSKLSNAIIKEGLLMPWLVRCKRISSFMYPAACRLCDGVADFSFNKSGFNLYTCRDCGLVQVHPPVSQAELEEYYGQTYFKAANTDTLSYRDYETSISFKKPLFDCIEGSLKLLDNVHKVLDIGSAYGDFVEHLQENEYDATGIDISEHAVAMAQSKGRNVLRRTLQDFSADPPNGRFDAVTMLDLFEHLSNPVEGLAQVRELLRPGGYAVILTPNTHSFVHRLLGRHWYLFTLPQHLNYFNMNNIRYLADEQGWRVVWADRMYKQFSLAYFLHFFAVWSGLRFVDRLHISLFDRLVFKYPFSDNMLVVLQRGD